MAFDENGETLLTKTLKCSDEELQDVEPWKKFILGFNYQCFTSSFFVQKVKIVVNGGEWTEMPDDERAELLTLILAAQGTN